MRIKIQTKEEYLAQYEEWEKWWAWHPAQIDGAIVWLEWVERKKMSSGWESFWSYRECQTS